MSTSTWRRIGGGDCQTQGAWSSAVIDGNGGIAVVRVEEEASDSLDESSSEDGPAFRLMLDDPSGGGLPQDSMCWGTRSRRFWKMVEQFDSIRIQ
jgi:hypothetical protein